MSTQNTSTGDGSNGKQECFVSVVTVLSNNGTLLDDFLPKAHAVLEEHFADFEIVLVDQCSWDDTEKRINVFRNTLSSLRYIRLASRVHDDVALAAGVENAIGDYVILLNVTNDPVDIIPALVQACRDGSDVIVGVCDQPRSHSYRLIRPIATRLLRAVGHNLPQNSTRLRCMSRLAVNALTYAGSSRHQFNNRTANTGLPTSEFEYEKNGNDEYRTLTAGIRQTMHLLVFSSTRPLRWISMLGLFGSLLAFGFGIYSLVIKLMMNSVIEGWTSTILIISTLFALMFTILAFFGEYLGRILDERGGQLEYHIANEISSSVMLSEDRLNIQSESDQRNEDMYD